jgi:hypothetical protein
MLRFAHRIHPNVSAFRRMPIPPDLQQVIDAAKSVSP